MKPNKKLKKNVFIAKKYHSLKKNNKKGIILRKQKLSRRKKKTIKKLNNLSFIYPILYLISYLLYFLSLEKCFEGEDICATKMTWIKKKVVELLISCLILLY